MLRHAAGERPDQRRGIARRVDDGAQVVARALRAAVKREHRVLEPGGDEVVLELAVVLQIDLARAPLHPVERRLGDVEMAGADQRLHVAVEEREQQRADVRAVHVGVGHDDDAVIAELRQVEVFGADAGAERGDDGADLGRAQHLVEPGALDIEDLAAQRQHRLIAAVTRLLGRAAGGITLDQEELAAAGVALLAVCELARQARDLERALAPGQVAGLPRSLPRRCGLDRLGDDRAGLGRVLFEPLAEPFADDPFHHRLDLGAHQLLLGLGGEFGIGHLDRENAGEPFPGVVAGDRDLLALGDAAPGCVAVDRTGQRRAEPRKVAAAIGLSDVVGKAEDRLVIAVVPLQRGLNDDVVSAVPDHDRVADQRLLGAVEVADECLDAALVVEGREPGLGSALVPQRDVQAGVEEGELAQAMLQLVEIELGLREDLARRQEGHARARALGGLARDAERRLRLAAGEAHGVFLAVAADAELQPLRERVHHRDADAVEPARDLVGALVELPAGMQLGHDDLGGGDALLLVDVCGDPAPVVAHRRRAVGAEHHMDVLAIAGERLVHGVVHRLVHHAVQAGAVVGIADVHPRPLAHGIEAAQDRDGLGAVRLGCGGTARGGVGHAPYSPSTMPGRTVKNCAAPPSGENTLRSVPVSHA